MLHDKSSRNNPYGCPTVPIEFDGTHNISWLFEQFKVDFSFPQNCLNLLSPESDQNQFSSITISKQAMI